MRPSKPHSTASTRCCSIRRGPVRAPFLPPLAASKVERIAYVSCHPVSFARDAAMLGKFGFALSKVRVFDMFPHTTHVETLGVFER